MWIPLGVAFGIPCETFYNLNPRKLKRYAPYYTEQRRQKLVEMDSESWLKGVYVQRAVSTIGKGRYPEKPLDPYNAMKKQEEDVKPVSDSERFATWAMAFNKAKFGTTSLDKESEVRKNGTES